MTSTDKNRRLGRGLSALLGETETESYAAPETGGEGGEARRPAGRDCVRMLPIELIQPNPEQPRKTITPAELDALAESIAEKGIVQPILVRPLKGEADRFEIVAGERRWRAAQRARLHEVPALVRELTDRETLEIGIVENVQRADLNPVEEAHAYRQLIDKFGHTQDDVARAVSKSRSHVANMVRLLALPGSVLDYLARGDISAGHARAIAAAPDPAALAEQIVEKGLSVREAERLARQAQGGPDAPETKAQQTAPAGGGKDADTRALEADIASRLGLSVDIRHGAKGGEIRVQYKTLEQLDDVCRRLSGEGRGA